MSVSQAVERLGPHQKAEVLIQALPWLRRFAGAVVVIKYGGHAMIDEELRRAFVEDVHFMHQVGLKPVIVHGGGPQINDMLKRLSIESTFVAGLRVTSEEALDVVRMVLTGKVQRELVNLINAEDSCAVGISGEDGGLLRARRRRPVVDGVETDIGRVGDVVEVDPTAVQNLLMAGQIPVVSSLASDIDDPGHVLNVNADTAASALAVALQAAKFMVATDVDALYADWPNRGSIIRHLTADEAMAMVDSVDAGMKPKLEACARAVLGGVPQAHMIDGRLEHALLLEVFTTDDMGTMIWPSGGCRNMPNRVGNAPR